MIIARRTESVNEGVILNAAVLIALTRARSIWHLTLLTLGCLFVIILA